MLKYNDCEKKKKIILATKHDPTCCLGLLKERETGGS